MALSEAYTVTGSSWGTETSLTSGTTTIQSRTIPGVYQLFVDVANLTSGDVYVVRLYERVRSTDSQRVVASWTLTGGLGEPVFATPGFHLRNGWDFTLQRTAGTDKTITASVRAVT